LVEVEVDKYLVKKLDWKDIIGILHPVVGKH
jgi:hypothetical protein